MVEQDKLLVVLAEKFVSNEWDERELVRYSPDGNRRFVFRSVGLEDRGRTDLELDIRHSGGGWMPVMEWKQSIDEGGINYYFTVGCDDGSLPFYDSLGEGSVSCWIFGADEEVESYWPEIVFDRDQIPEVIDVDLTVELFRNQVIRGDFSRPVLVPAGKFKYEPPVHLGGDSYAYSMNISRAALLLRTGRNAEEERAYEALWRWVVEKELELR